MGVTASLINLEELYTKVPGEHIIVNDIPYNGGISGEDLFNNIITVYEGETISTIPKCLCPLGEGLSGRVRLGHVCSKCGSQVKEVHENIDPNLWLRAINVDGITVPFINPIFWMMLCRIMTGSTRGSGQVDYVRYLCDDYYALPVSATMSKRFSIITEILNNVLGGQRSYYNFITHLKDVLEYMVKHPEINNKKKGDTSISPAEALYQIYLDDMKTRNGKGIFTTILPILSSHIFVMENNAKGRYATLKSAININVVRGWLKFCKDIRERELLGNKPITIDKVGREVAKVLYELNTLNISFLNDHFYQKSGLIRKHVFGARVHFSSRSVIVCIEGPHDRRSIELPWAAVVSIYRPYLYSKLVKERGFSAREAEATINAAVKKYSDLVYEMLMEIRAATPNGNMPVIMHRNQLGSLIA